MKMAIIVFMLFHWASDLNPTFALARKLRNSVHHIHYFGIPDIAERIRSEGFDFIPVFSRAFPEGTLAKQYENEAQGKRYGISTLISVEDSAVPPFNTNLIPEDHADPARLTPRALE
jgi:UDP:flavonoid glycosyltransferase YjiC (YdhE family)